MWLLLILAHASEPDADLRWLEDRDAPEVLAWRDARSEEARAWVEEGGLVDTLADALKAWTEAYRQNVWLADHRDGVSIWQTRRPHADNDREPDPRRWRYHVELVAQGDGFERPLPLPDGADDTWAVCGATLSPGGRTVAVGRRAPEPDPTEPGKAPQPCSVLLVDLASGEVRDLGAHRRYAAGFEPGGTLVMSTWTTGRSTLERLSVADGATREPLSRQRRWVVPIVSDDGGILWWSSPRKRRGKRGVSLKFRFDDDRWSRLPRARWSFVGADDGLLYLATGRGTEQRRVVGVDPARPGKRRWETVLEGTEAEPLLHAALHGDRLLVARRHDGSVRFYERGLAPDSEEDSPLGGPFSWASTMRTLRETAIVTTGSPGVTTFWQRSRADGAYQRLAAPSLVDAVFRKAEVTSADGTGIPVSWVHAAGAEPDGQAPVWLRAYGGFGIGSSLHLGPTEAMWLRMGGVLATVHARGGDERGEEWHEGARREHIGKTFEDVIGAGEWFVEEGWTAPGRLVVSGGSNGGLTAMACVALRPDLFGAGISDAGLLDLVRGKHMGATWWGREYGRPGDADQREVLRRYSPVHATPQGLPPVWITTGREDPTVPPSHSYKLKAAWDLLDGGPALLRVWPWTSHANHLSKKKWEASLRAFDDAAHQRAVAEELAFLVRALDLDTGRIGEPPARGR